MPSDVLTETVASKQPINNSGWLGLTSTEMIELAALCVGVLILAAIVIGLAIFLRLHRRVNQPRVQVEDQDDTADIDL